MNYGEIHIYFSTVPESLYLKLFRLEIKMLKVCNCSFMFSKAPNDDNFYNNCVFTKIFFVTKSEYFN